MPGNVPALDRLTLAAWENWRTLSKLLNHRLLISNVQWGLLNKHWAVRSSTQPEEGRGCSPQRDRALCPAENTDGEMNHCHPFWWGLRKQSALRRQGRVSVGGSNTIKKGPEGFREKTKEGRVLQAERIQEHLVQVEEEVCPKHAQISIIWKPLFNVAAIGRNIGNNQTTGSHRKTLKGMLWAYVCFWNWKSIQDRECFRGKVNSAEIS